MKQDSTFYSECHINNFILNAKLNRNSILKQVDNCRANPAIKYGVYFIKIHISDHCVISTPDMKIIIFLKFSVQ